METMGPLWLDGPQINIQKALEHVWAIYKEQTGPFEYMEPLELDGAPDE